MPTHRWIPPEAELEVGLGFYATSSPPVNGRVKADAEDFEVREISNYPIPDRTGPYTILNIRSRDWEQHELAQRIAGRLGLAPHAISWAGTKDRRAISERLFSYRGRPPDRDLEIPGVALLDAYTARDGVALGHHYGNSFSIRVSELAIPETEAIAAFEPTRAALRAQGGFPNFFGLQRFGEVRPVTHRVGRDLVLGNPSEAVETYLTFVPENGGREMMGVDARRQYAQDHDPLRALRDFPPSFRFERRLLDHLARGHSPGRALGALSRELRRLFIHAYQALLFNRWLCARWNAELPFDRPEPGDRLLRRGPDGTMRGVDPIPVGSDNLPECRELVARDRAVIAGPLVGFETPTDDTPIGRLLTEILSEEHVTPSDFQLPKTPELASAGSWRPAIVPMPPTTFEAGPRTGPPPTGTGPGVWVHFSLPKGSYATILVREFLKPGARPTEAYGRSRPTPPDPTPA